MTNEQQVAAVRSFNRFWTARIGALQPGLVDTPFSLTEARVLFELGRAEVTPMQELRERLGLDAGYVSRIVTKLREQGLVTTDTSPDDARRQMIRLTPLGVTEYEIIDHRSDLCAAAVLDGYSAYARERMVSSMQCIQQLAASPGPPKVTLRAPQPGDYGWVVNRHGAVYAEEQGWDSTFEALVAGIVGHFAARTNPREAAWIADIDGSPVGSVFCYEQDEETAQLRLLLVEPSTRGLGIGSQLVDECITFARSAGYTRIVLRTNAALAAARRLYEAAEFSLVDELPDETFVGAPPAQIWARAL